MAVFWKNLLTQKPAATEIYSSNFCLSFSYKNCIVPLKLNGKETGSTYG